MHVIDKTSRSIARKLAEMCGHPWGDLEKQNVHLLGLKYSAGGTKWSVRSTGVSISVGDCELWVRRHDCKVEDLTGAYCEIDELQRCVAMAAEIRAILKNESEERPSKISDERAKCVAELRGRAAEIRREHLEATGDVFDVNMMAAAYSAAAEYLESRTVKP